MSADALTLAALSAPHWKPRTTDSLYDPNATANSCYPHRIIFRRPDRIVRHAFSQGPLYIANDILRRVDLFNYGTNDGFFVDSLLDQLRREEIAEATSVDPILLLELDDADGVRYGAAEKPLRKTFAEMLLIYPYSARRYWLFETEVDLISGEIGAEISPEAHRVFLAELHADLEALPHVVERDAERDRIRPDYSRGPLFRLTSG